MSKHLFPKLTLALVFMVATFPALSQVAPAASDAGAVPLKIGVGISDYAIDWSASRMEGISAWVDWAPIRFPGILRGLGFEGEGHGIDWNKPKGVTKMRQDSALGGLIYTYRHYRKFDPYVKYMGGVGSIDFPPFNRSAKSQLYTHDIFNVIGPGGGVDYRLWRHISVRADYEYQFWQHPFGHVHDLTPQGFTVGAVYNFRRATTDFQ